MTAIIYPREYASDATFGSGPDAGQPTRVDPGAAAEAQGSIAGLPFAAATYNYSMNALSKASRWAVEQALLTLFAPVVPDEANMPDRAFDGPGVAVTVADDVVLVIKGGFVWRDAGSTLQRLSPSTAAATQPVAATYVGGVVGVAGADGDSNVARSADEGVTFTTYETNTASTPAQCLVSTPQGGGIFIWSSGTAGEVYTDADLSGAKGTRTLSAAHEVCGIAIKESSFRILVLRDNGGAPAFDSSVNAVAFSDTGAAPTSTADFGAIACDDNLFFWAGKNSSNEIAVWASSTGASWAQLATIASPGGTIDTGPSCRLVCEVSSGILWLAVSVGSVWYLYASPDSGVTWLGPRSLGEIGTPPSLSVASGHLYVGIHEQPMLRTVQRLA